MVDVSPLTATPFANTAEQSMSANPVHAQLQLVSGPAFSVQQRRSPSEHPLEFLEIAFSMRRLESDPP